MYILREGEVLGIGDLVGLDDLAGLDERFAVFDFHWTIPCFEDIIFTYYIYFFITAHELK